MASYNTRPPICLRRSNGNTFGNICTGLIFLGLGYLMRFEEPSASAFFMSGALIYIGICIYRLRPEVEYLKLTRAGLVIKTVFSQKFLAWKDIDYFTTYQNEWIRYVGWAYRNESPQNSTSTIYRWLHRVGNGSVDDGLTCNFGRSAESLAMLLEQWRRDYS